ncbi:MAG: WD40/YVTN/BNR-like repeat-containing protein [Chitinophagaceae bacterium]
MPHNFARIFGSLFFSALLSLSVLAQKKTLVKNALPETSSTNLDEYFRSVYWRNIGPTRGGRSVTSTGVKGDPLTYYMGTTGGGVWKTEDAGQTWKNISDGFFQTGSVGAVAVADADPNVVFVGMGEHAPRGVMTSYGDGVYKSTDAGKTWKHLGLELTRHISSIRIHPNNPDIVYVGAQGALHGSSKERGIYKSEDGGKTWKNILYVDENSGCVDLSVDMNNPRILYAAMWDHRRLPWAVQSGGKGSGLYKSTDGGETWIKIQNGLPKELGKMAISVSQANSNKVYALIESDTEKEQGGLFVSNDAGINWRRISKDHRLVSRAWYYIEVFADPQHENTVYVLGAAGLKSTDGGQSWTNIRGTHGDYHQLWINPKNNQNMIISNDGGAAVTFNGGNVWTSQNNQPTAQFYRINVDNLFPYNIYAGQQDNTSVKIASRNLQGGSIGDRQWTYSAGGESAFLGFDPNNPRYVMGGSYQGTIELLDTQTGEGVGVMVYPMQYQAMQPKDMTYRFNWNAPIAYSKHEKNVYYHAGNRLFRTRDMGKSWEAISPDLTTHDTTKMGISGYPYTNEGAGGENYCTIAYFMESDLEKGVMYTGSDDGLVYVTKDDGKNWVNITPADLGEALINAIEVSPHDPATVYIAATKYKFNDFTPFAYKSNDYGKTWTKVIKGLPYGACVRVLREDNVRKNLLFAGTEIGLFISYDGGNSWSRFQRNLPVTPITDLKVHQNNLIASTQGRAFWILDELQPLRGFDSQANVKLMPIHETYRISGYSIFDSNDGDTTRYPNTTSANPATGAVIYYHLPNDSIKHLSIQIKDAQGNIVRSFSNKSIEVPSTNNSLKEEPVLSVKKGLNRFVWNLRRPDMPTIDNVYIEGNYNGGKIVPGAYSIVLKADDVEQTATLKFSQDPRLQYSNADYAAQDALLKKLEKDMVDIHVAVNQMNALSKQIEDLNKLIQHDDTKKDLVDKGKSVIEKIKQWKEKLIQPKAQSYDDIINFVNKLSANIIFVHGELSATVPYVTVGQEKRYVDLHAEWLVYEKQMKDLLSNDVAGYNQMCRDMGVTNVILPK